MRIAVTGGTGFVGRHLVDLLLDAGHEVVVIGRRPDPETAQRLRAAGPRARFAMAEIDDATALDRAFAGCAAVAHCAGINREIGRQTYDRVHVQGTRRVVEAARRAGARRIAILSFLRARPDCGSGYHESKWAAEEIVRASGLEWTALKAGVIYGPGDHMLDHLSRALHTLPVFGLVGLRRAPIRPIRPVAVADVANVLAVAVTTDRLAGRTIAVLGPDELPLEDAVRRVASVTGRRPHVVRLPVWCHLLLARVFEAVMVVPLVSVAQVRILAEGIVEPLPFAEEPPAELAPRTPFDARSIAAGLPEPRGFGRSDLRCPLTRLGAMAIHR